MTQTKTKPNPAIDAEVVNAPLVPQGTPAGALAERPLPSCASLAGALAAAQRKCSRVSKDSRNEYHRYDYASSEAVIEAAQHALADTGLSLLPLEQTLSGWERQGENRFELTRKFLLLHSSGESLPLAVAWPVVPEKGRPLDKATAIAATLSLAYLLRDLLLMPRVDPAEDVNTRDDTRHVPPKAAPPKPAPRPAEPERPMTGPELTEYVKRKDAELAKAGVIRPNELLDAYDSYATQNAFPDVETEWGEAQVRVIRGHLADWVKSRQRAAKAAK